MSRPIKFRAYSNELKRTFEVSDMIVGPTVTSWVKDKEYSRMLVHGENGFFMQFTGLTDAKGKEIFEGDIVVNRYLLQDTNCVVEFRNACFFVRSFKSSPLGHWVEHGEIKNLEVLGNIYENPELVKL